MRARVIAAAMAVALSACRSSGAGDPPAPPPPPPPLGPAPEFTLLAEGISFLPEWMSTAERLRPSLVVSGGEVFFTDASDAPVKKVSIDGGPVTPLAFRMGIPEWVVVDGGRVVWTVEGRLVETDPAKETTRILADGNLDATPRPLLDASGAYWVRTVDGSRCSPPCTWRIERIGDAGTVTLAEPSRPPVALAQDALYVYWEENSMEPWSPQCDCGSTIRKAPKSSGASTVLVDGRLNGLLPNPPPGHIPGSWFTTGGIATDGSHVYFAEERLDADRVLRVPASGGSVEVLASLTRPTDYDTSRTPRRFALGETALYWIDSNSLRSIPRSGGVPATVASGLEAPVDLAIADRSAFVLERATGRGAGRIRQVPLDGGASSIAFAGLDWPGALALDSSRLYWSEAWRLATAQRAGGAATTLATGIQSAQPRIVVVGQDVIVLDGSLLKRVPRSGGPPEPVTTVKCMAPEGSTGYAEDFVSDGANVYLAFRANGPSPNSACKVPLDGGPGVSFTAPGTTSPQECLVRVAVDGASVYWTAGASSPVLGCAIHKAPIGGGDAVRLVEDVLDFALDAADLYFTSGQYYVVDGSGTHFHGTDAVNRISAEGGPVTTWAQPGYPFVIAADASRIYWIGLEGTVSWIGKDGAGWSSYGTPFDETALHVDAIAADGTSVYWTNSLLGTVAKLTVP